MRRFTDSHQQVIDQWPDIKTFAAEIGVSVMAARHMHKRNFINPRYWTKLVARAHERDLPVTYKGLAEWCAVRDSQILGS